MGQVLKGSQRVGTKAMNAPRMGTKTKTSMKDKAMQAGPSQQTIQNYEENMNK